MQSCLLEIKIIKHSQNRLCFCMYCLKKMGNYFENKVKDKYKNFEVLEIINNYKVYKNMIKSLSFLEREGFLLKIYSSTIG